MTQKLIVAGLLSLVVQAVLFVLPQPAALGIAPPNAPRTTHCVNTTGAGGCSTSIQTAINASSYGDLVNIYSGTYTEHITMTNGVSIHGQGWGNTIINGNHSAAQPTVYVSSGINASTVLSGVKIMGGGTGTPGVVGSGLQMWWASPTIINTRVVSSTGNYGGGVYVRGGSPTFNNVPAWQNAPIAAADSVQTVAVPSPSPAIPSTALMELSGATRRRMMEEASLPLA